MDRYLVVGAGLSGAVLARELAEQLPCIVDVIDERGHIGGNCHTFRDEHSGVMIHAYGPHIFNTDDKKVWDYVNQHGFFRPYTHRVKSIVGGSVYSLPINLHTLNQFFGRAMNPSQASAYLAGLGDVTIQEPANFEEQALKLIGRELYEAFFKGYTTKQCGSNPRELPASILKRLPIRFNYDDNYYEKKFSGIPEEGYGEVIASILRHPSIRVHLGKCIHPSEITNEYEHVFWTGPIDAYFDYSEGRLGYRTVTFERIDATGDYQGNAQINYPGMDMPFTRIHEHKHFTPWERHERTVAFREYSKETSGDDIPYYPKRFSPDLEILKRYHERAEPLKGISFLGRLGTYRYMDMEAVIRDALNFASESARRLLNEKHPSLFPE
jgi:UDP-galactopyranose mutase